MSTVTLKTGNKTKKIQLMGSLGQNLPEAEGVSFSATQIEPEERYSIGYNWFAQVVERLRVMVNDNRDFTPDEIVYWLDRVMFITLDFESTASGILPTVYKGAANSEFAIDFDSSADLFLNV